jgi:putative transposase
MPRIRAELRDTGHAVSRRRVARLMREAHIRAQPAPAAGARSGESLVPGRSARRAVGDRHTQIPTWAGFVYLAVMPDAFSRKVVGW